MKYDAGKALLTADLAGTFLFGIEGADAAIRGNLDLLGMMVLAFSTALAGGVVRDLLIGAVPPESIKNWRYATTAFVAAMLTFFFYRMVQAFPAQLLMVLDAAGLALFAVAGTERRHSITKFIRSWRRCWERSREWAAGRFAIFFWPRYRACCNPTFMRRQP
jgi:uncharacterized membrane protein YeiH